MIRKVTAASVIALGLLGPAVVAGPASAGAGSTNVGCTGSSSCSIFLQKFVSFGGNTAPGMAINTSVPITPPPCDWIPAGGAKSGSQQVIADGGGYAPPPATLNTPAVKQAKQLLKNPQPGEWYALPVRQGDTPAETAACMKLPYYYWVAPGTAPPPVPIPPATLRDLAFAKLAVPQFQSIQLNPAARSYTNLPTFVKARLPAGSFQPAPGGAIYLAVTAVDRATGQSATVWVPAGTFNISAPGATPWTSRQCSMVDSQGMLGSKWSQAQMQRTGPNQPIDCGATFTQPGKTTVTVSLNWQAAVWAPNTGPDGYRNPPPGGAAPVRGGGTLWPSQAVRPVTVAEIQSINTGG